MHANCAPRASCSSETGCATATCASSRLFLRIFVCPSFLGDVSPAAYYLKYQNKRLAYVEAFWNVLNWAEVEKRYAAALAKPKGEL